MTTPTSPTTVRLAGGAQGFNWLPVFVAVELGLFAERGLQIEFLRMGSVDKATAAVQDGAADLAITPPEGAVADHAAGGDLRIVGANSVRLPMSMVARPGITDLQGLRGARIGTSSLTEGTALYTQLLLGKHGLTYPGDYEFVLAGVHTSRWEALRNGEIDAAPQPAPWNFLAQDEGYQLVAEIDDAIPEVVFAGLIGSAPWLAANADVVRALTTAMSAAHDIVNDPDRDDVTLPVYQRLTTPDDAGLAARGLAYTRDTGMWPTGMGISSAAFAATTDLMQRAGLLTPEQAAAAGGVLQTGMLPEGR